MVSLSDIKIEIQKILPKAKSAISSQVAMAGAARGDTCLRFKQNTAFNCRQCALKFKCKTEFIEHLSDPAEHTAKSGKLAEEVHQILLGQIINCFWRCRE